MLARLSLFDPPYPPCLPDLAIIFFVMFYHLFYTRPRAGLRPAGPRWDRREGTVLMGTLFMPRFAPAALSSKETDCSSEDLQKMVKTYSWFSDTIFEITYFKWGQWTIISISLNSSWSFSIHLSQPHPPSTNQTLTPPHHMHFFEDQPQHFRSKTVTNGVPRGAPSSPKPLRTRVPNNLLDV